MPADVGIVDLLIDVPAGDLGEMPHGYLFKQRPDVPGGDPVVALLTEMDRHGIERGMIPVGAEPDDLRARAVRDHPDRLFGSAESSGLIAFSMSPMINSAMDPASSQACQSMNEYPWRYELQSMSDSENAAIAGEATRPYIRLAMPPTAIGFVRYSISTSKCRNHIRNLD